MERYRTGKPTTPRKHLRDALVEEAESEWQPQVGAQTREQAATSGGMRVEVTAHFGFACRVSSDDGRERSITTAISPTYAKQTLELQEAGASTLTSRAVVRIGADGAVLREIPSGARPLLRARTGAFIPKRTPRQGSSARQARAGGLTTRSCPAPRPASRGP
ncbi:hypothetical protein ACH4FA_29810 [Streptomyces sp. NPDC017966]|uniref:hypothetical protein n=1 Tax=Streptomyces sp. NPDC017966 TaxID=3365023 RepID=UPI0037A48C19